MALNQPWVVLITLAITLSVFLLIWLKAKKTKTESENVVLLANTNRLTATPAYKKLLTTYKAGIIVAVACLSLIVVSTIVISGKPVTVSKETPLKYNRDIVLCLDVSGSMTLVDEKVIERFHEMTEGFKGERIALVIFNSTSNQVFPLTDDYEYIKEQFEYVNKGLSMNPSVAKEGYPYLFYTLNSEGASLIGDGLTACSLSFDSSNTDEKRSRSIILATDNVPNGTELISLVDAAKAAKEKNITVYGINGETGYETPDTKEQFKQAVEITGGSWFLLDDLSVTSQIVDKITSEETTAIKSEEIIIKTDTPQIWIVLSAFGLLVFLVLARRFRF